MRKLHIFFYLFFYFSNSILVFGIEDEYDITFLAQKNRLGYEIFTSDLKSLESIYIKKGENIDTTLQILSFTVSVYLDHKLVIEKKCFGRELDKEVIEWIYKCKLKDYFVISNVIFIDNKESKEILSKKYLLENHQSTLVH